jgi:uncharacterized membrane protein YphA (DoxX/SURF4 family)
LGKLKKTLHIALGLVFLASATAKLVSIKEFELYVFSLGLLSFDLVSYASRLLIILEAGTGLWLLSGWKQPLARAVTGLQLLAFSAFLVWRVILQDTESCHCFGNLVEMDPWQSLSKNAVLAIMLVLCGNELYYKPLPLGLIAGTLAFTVIVFAAYPPDSYYRRVADEPHYVNQEKWAEQAQTDSVTDKKIVCFFSTQCEHCINCAKKLSIMLSREQIDRENVLIYFMDYNDSAENEISLFLKDIMAGVDYPYTLLSPLDFIPITNGVMPVVIIADGEVIMQEFNSQSMTEKALRQPFLPQT